MPCGTWGQHCTLNTILSVGVQVKSERAALDQMRAEFENELQQARGEMQRAQDALQGQLLFCTHKLLPQ